MTLRVYRLNARTGERRPLTSVTVEVSDSGSQAPGSVVGFPPCRCPRCRPGPGAAVDGAR
jgi:hypothetical protein